MCVAVTLIIAVIICKNGQWTAHTFIRFDAPLVTLLLFFTFSCNNFLCICSITCNYPQAHAFIMIKRGTHAEASRATSNESSIQLICLSIIYLRKNLLSLKKRTRYTIHAWWIIKASEECLYNYLQRLWVNDIINLYIFIFTMETQAALNLSYIIQNPKFFVKSKIYRSLKTVNISVDWYLISLLILFFKKVKNFFN